MNINSVLIISSVMTLVMLILPIAAAFFLFYKRMIFPKPFFIGALAFGVSQLVLRMPIMNILAAVTDWYVPFVSTVIGAVIVGGLSAGLFEESARLICAKTILKDRTSFSAMLSFGLGHGLCEVVLLLGTSSINTLLMAVSYKRGSYDQMLAAGAISEEALTQITAALSTLTVPNMFISILERISAIGFHVFASALVFKAVNDKNIIWYFAAVLAHTLFNSVVLLPISVIAVEIIIFILAGLGILAVIKMKKSFPEPGAAAVLTPEEELTM